MGNERSQRDQIFLFTPVEERNPGIKENLKMAVFGRRKIKSETSLIENEE